RAKFEALKSRYYELVGWDVNTGCPTRAKLEELGLKDVADELAGAGKSVQ
ncbi:aldehyde ferredoxin oxidoreductase C-terminal domain-containing protein, partial [Chloroflexota bacterium]